MSFQDLKIQSVNAHTHSFMHLYRYACMILSVITSLNNLCLSNTILLELNEPCEKKIPFIVFLLKQLCATDRPILQSIINSAYSIFRNIQIRLFQLIKK